MTNVEGLIRMRYFCPKISKRILVYPCPSVANSFSLRNWKLSVMHSKFAEKG